MPDIETHGTVGNRVLCQFTADPPREWEEGHARVDATIEANHRLVTCTGCKPRLKSVVAQKQAAPTTGLEVEE